MPGLHYYFIYVCPECGVQARGPGSHSVAGDDCCSNGSAHDDGVGQPTLMKVEVSVIDVGTSRHLHRAHRRGEERSAEHYARIHSDGDKV